MVNTIIRIELFRHFVQPRHTAFTTTRIKGNIALRHRKGQRESAPRGDKPPAYGHNPSQSGQLDALVLKAADFVFTRKVGCFCFFVRYYRARGPPIQDFALKILY
ncbi:hypothetical protein DS742_17350 [Lacrimispora amygdalina]|uniref:Uncharacterized protein n=1 Tax=Lacrimispora amygdalina TaxID=253257 RepID=A0A3E2N9C2_9FIRM|nr:hypothetical protein [Clostridium indicum]RFZ77582.1 hypothetical protein DS742_17350 [Clostridium indicum]